MGDTLWSGKLHGVDVTTTRRRLHCLAPKYGVVFTLACNKYYFTCFCAPVYVQVASITSIWCVARQSYKFQTPTILVAEAAQVAGSINSAESEHKMR